MTDADARPEITGIDPQGLTQWFVENVDGVQAPLTFERISGGLSNITVGITDASGRAFVLRRPPTGHLLPTAHDVLREHRIVNALRDSPVPVARTVGACDDSDVTGASFYVMDRVDGVVVGGAEAARTSIDLAARQQSGRAIPEVLARIHAVDVDVVGLGTLAKREGYVERQLNRWEQQFQQSNAVTGRPLPAATEVLRRLRRRLPPQGPATMVHGDYRLDNCILTPGGDVAAVLDWELCTLGDPMADLGQLVASWDQADDTDRTMDDAATVVEGFCTRAQIVERYAAASGRDVSNLDYYLAFTYWRMCGIAEGVEARRMAATGTPAFSAGPDVSARVINKALQASESLA